MTEKIETPLLTVRSEKVDVFDLVETRLGFLRIETNVFDRCFISIVIRIAISLFWFRFIELLELSIWISNALSAARDVFIVKKG